jgi:hypothetical protein
MDAEGNFHSPSLILDHEVNHVIFSALNLPQYLNYKHALLRNTGLTSRAEQKAITETNLVSIRLSNGDGGYGGRIYHYGEQVHAFGVRDFLLTFYLDQQRRIRYQKIAANAAQAAISAPPKAEEPKRSF